MRTYFVTMAILGAVTACMMLPDMALVTAVLTFGLAAPILITAVTFFFYGLCFLPTALLGWRFWWVSAPLIVGLALGPGWLDRRPLDQIVAGATAEDIAVDPTKQLPWKFVAIVTTSNDHWLRSRFEGAGLTSCFALCQALLENGGVESVRVGSQQGDNFVDYILNEGQIEVQSQRERRVDLTFWIGSRASQLAVGEAEKVTLGDRPAGMGIARVTVTTNNRTQQFFTDPVIRKTDVIVPVVSYPTTLTPSFTGLTSGGNKGGLSIIKESWQSDAFTLFDVAESLGIQVGPFETTFQRHKRIGGEERERDNAARKDAFIYARHSVYQVFAAIPHPDPSGPRPDDIRTWLKGLNHYQDSLTDLDRVTIRQILDRREPSLTSDARWLFWQDDELAKEFFPRLISELERADTRDDRLIDPMLESLQFGQDYNDEFTKYRDQIKALMEDQLARDPAGQHLGLIAAAYRFGIDERPYLIAFPTGKDFNAFLSWKNAICQMPSGILKGYGDEVLGRVRPFFLNEKEGELPRIYYDVLGFAAFHGADTGVRQLFADAGRTIDSNSERRIFESRGRSESICRGINRRRF